MIREEFTLAPQDAANPRLAATRIVARWLETGDFPDRMLDAVVRGRAAVIEIVFGTVKWRRELEWILNRYARHTPDVLVQAALLTALYQTFHMESSAGYAVVNETVNLLKAAGANQRVANFANAILRQVARERGAIPKLLADQPLGVRMSHPDLLVQRWQVRWGEHRTYKLCAWNNGRPDLVIRVFLSRIALDAFIRMLTAAKVAATPHPYAPDRFLVLEDGGDVRRLPGYDNGYFTVQDPSTFEAIRLLNPQPGERILDACAAPGGKSMAIAELMEGMGSLVAMDRHTDRLERLGQNAARMGFPAISVVKGDLNDPDCAKICGERFDRILLDVPCSNTGVLRRRSDARWRFSPERLTALIKTQRAMLSHGARLLKPGGFISYSTCSLEPDEGQTMVQEWLRHHTEFNLVRQIELFPPDSHTDGIYAALLKHTPA